MENYLRKKNFILIAGLIGIAAASITVISDVILLGKPDTAYKFFNLGTEAMAGLAPWRITIGTFLGVFALPFQIAGIIPLYYGLKPAGSKRAGVFFMATTYALIMGVAFHVSYAFIGSTWKMQREAVAVGIEVNALLSRFQDYWMIIIVSIFAVIVLASICFVLLIMTRKALYPKWMLFFNPFGVFMLLFPVIAFIPAPVGGFIAPAYLNLATLLMFILSLKFLKPGFC